MRAARSRRGPPATSGRQERRPVRPRPSAATRSTSAAGGTTPAITASTSSTVASPCGCCKTSTRRSPLRPHRGHFRRREAEHPRVEERAARPARRGALRPRSHAADAGAGGQPMAGMVHHKIHGEKWSAIPTCPTQDEIKRYLRPVSTAATLNLAAMAAQAARLWKKLDPAFSTRCLAAAETAYAAAQKNPAIRAERRHTRRRRLRRRRSSTTSGTGRRPSCSSRPASLSTRDDLVHSRLHTPKAGAAITAAT